MDVISPRVCHITSHRRNWLSQLIHELSSHMQSAPVKKQSRKVRCTCGCGRYVAPSTKRAHLNLQTRTGIAASSIEQFGLESRQKIDREVGRKRRQSVLTEDKGEQPGSRRFATPETAYLDDVGVDHQDTNQSTESVAERNQQAINIRWGEQNVDIQAIEDSSNDEGNDENVRMLQDEDDDDDYVVGEEEEGSEKTSEDEDENMEENIRPDNNHAGSVSAGATQTLQWDNDDTQLPDTFLSAGS
jgi:hypothetical protein